jgi:hypothetical protein
MSPASSPIPASPCSTKGRLNLYVSRVNKLPLARGRCLIPEHAFASAVTRLDLVDLVAAGNWLIRLRQCGRSSLQGYAKTFSGQYRARARQAAGLVQERVDSPQETLLRLCLVLAGLPEPGCNITIGSYRGPAPSFSTEWSALFEVAARYSVSRVG